MLHMFAIDSMGESLLSSINLNAVLDIKNIVAEKITTINSSKIKPTSGSYTYLGWNIQNLPGTQENYFACILSFNHISNMLDSSGKSFVNRKCKISLTNGGTYNGGSNLSLTPIMSATLKESPSLFGYALLLPCDSGWMPIQSLTVQYGEPIKSNNLIFAGDDYLAYNISRFTGNMSCDIYGIKLDL